MLWCDILCGERLNGRVDVNTGRYFVAGEDGRGCLCEFRRNCIM